MPDTDLVLLSERVGQLLEENKNLKEEKLALQNEVSRAVCKRWVRSTFALSIFAPLSIGLGSLAGYPIHMSWKTPDVPTHCYITPKSIHAEMPIVYELTGSIPWHNDRDLGYHITLEAAIEAAKKMGCPLR
jgi:hypothetical protein